MSNRPRVAYVVGFGAPPVLHLADFIQLLASAAWDTYVILSPTAATWVDMTMLAHVSGHPVRVEPRTPREQDPLPPAEAVIAAPLTFNSLNKWAMGISDTLALGILHESLGLDVDVTAAPCAKAALRFHPAYKQSLQLLTSTGVTFVGPVESTFTESGPATIDWRLICPQQRHL